jgi:tryptophan halogenase
MAGDHIPRIVIVGGGLTGWMAAAALAHAFKDKAGKITLIEPPETHKNDGGVASLPTMRLFHDRLGIDENDFIRKTKARFSLGTEFRGWTVPGQAFLHPFGQYGTSIETVGFHHCWLKLRQLGDKTGLADYSLASAAAARGRFMRPVRDTNSVLSSFSYGFHLDRRLYAGYLRDYALDRGVTRDPRNLAEVKLRDDGAIDTLILGGDGGRLEADLYVDCSNAALLIEGALNTGFEDWSRWLPCDRMIACRSESATDMHPITHVTARASGWQSCIPIQHRATHAYIYGSRFTNDLDARNTLLANIAEPVSREIAMQQFTNGRRRKFWNLNCVALGAAAGFLEPLESTDIHLMQSGIARLLQLLPVDGIIPTDIDEYNRLTEIEFTHIRDFLIFHYHAARPAESPLWDHCRNMEIPESLAYRIELFRSRGRVVSQGDEVFSLPNWLSLFAGLNIAPRRYHPFADGIPIETLKQQMHLIKGAIRNAADAMPEHCTFLAQIVAPARVI